MSVLLPTQVLACLSSSKTFPAGLSSLKVLKMNLSSRIFALHMQGPGFDPQHHTHTKILTIPQVGNVGPKSDHVERSDLAKRFFIAG
jgi:hypothetical protein